MIAQADGMIMQRWRISVDMSKEAVPACQALSAIFQITGNVDVPGGMIAPPSILPYYAGWGGENLSDEQKEKRLGIHKYPLYRYGFKNASTDVTIECLETGKDELGNDYPLKAGWLQTTNPLHQLLARHAPHLPRARQAGIHRFGRHVHDPHGAGPGRRLPCPACAFAERNGIRIGDGVQRGETINKAVQVGEAKSNMVINLEIGKRICPEFYPWDTEEEMFSHILEGMDMTFEELREAAPTYLDFEYKKYEKGLLREDGQPGFQTGTGRIELWSSYFNQIGIECVPSFDEPSPGPVANPDLYEEYPLILTTGARTWSLFHSEHRQVPRLRALRPDPVLQMHPEAAQKYGIAEGDWVWVENHRGRAEAPRPADRGARPAVLLHRPRLVDAGTTRLGRRRLQRHVRLQHQPASGLRPGSLRSGSNYKTVLCRVYKCEEGDHNTLANPLGTDEKAGE